MIQILLNPCQNIKYIMIFKHWIRSIGPSMFEGEALGLGAMYETGSIRVPKPFKVCNVNFLYIYQIVCYSNLSPLFGNTA